ncbi:MAG: ribonuclease P protein component [Bacteroidia bacterium]
MKHRSGDRQRFTFSKEERLCQRRAFDYLFEHGSSVRADVLKIFFAFDCPDEWSSAPLAIALAVPKRSFKRAVDRNLLKRRLREAFRLNKSLLLTPLVDQEHRAILLIKYLPNKRCSFDQIEQALCKGLRQVERRIPPRPPMPPTT